MERRVFLVSLWPLAACACADSYDCGSEPKDGDDARRKLLECEQPPTAPTPVPEPPKANTIEFRVLGDVTYDGAVSGTVIQWGSNAGRDHVNHIDPTVVRIYKDIQGQFVLGALRICDWYRHSPGTDYR